ncbi:MAG: 30S ribosomal protein S1 [Candidatus Dasytiphilus stammeri]
MTESFAKIFEESVKQIQSRPGSIVSGIIVAIDKDIVLVDSGLKSESSISIEQFKNSHGELDKIETGEKIDVSLETIENGFGETVLSREKAKRHESWLRLEKAHAESANITGIINGKVKGGLTVDINGVRAFLPGSLVDIRPMRDSQPLEGKELEFKVIKLDLKRNNVVLSRKAVIELENNAERQQLLSNLQEGRIIKGIIKNLTDYGAFVDLGGIDGLLHITDMSWKRVKHPSEIVKIGTEIKVKVLKFDRERIRVSLGLKQLGEDPWISLAQRYPAGTRKYGRITNLTDYGAFVELEEGVEGLVHVSEMDWTNKNINPSKIVHVGDMLEVMVLDIDESRRRISLGLKQCKTNPWQTFANSYQKGDKVHGKIKSITDFGMFIGLEGNIDGLVHLSDISWYLKGEEAVGQYNKGQEITAVVLQVDVERQRISLSIKQLSEDPLNQFLSVHNRGALVTGKIISVDQKGVKIQLCEGVEGYLRYPEGTNHLNFHIKDVVDSKLSGVDRKNRIIILSSTEKEEEKNNSISSNNKTSDCSSAMAEAFKAAKIEDK